MAGKLILLVEEPSMEAALDILLPRMLGQDSDTKIDIVRFQCKDDLLKKLPERLRGYSAWLPSGWVLLVLIDRDGDDCRVLKQTLEHIAAEARLVSKTTAGPGQPFQIVNRIAIEELEAWFFGDWAAVQAAYPRVPATIPKKTPYRDPDAIAGGTWEALERVLKQAGYFATGLRKIECARTIAAHMVPERNTSASFGALREAVRAVVTQGVATSGPGRS